MEDQGFYAHFYVAKSVLEDAWSDDFCDCPFDSEDVFVDSGGHTYKPGGFDQIRLIVYGLDTVERVLKDQNMRMAIRVFNLNLMRKGENFYPQNHCPQLADMIFSEKNDR